MPVPDATITPRAQALLARLEGWAHRSPVRSLLIKAGVTLVGPIMVLAGVAMTVLPGPGLVVVALGLALLALEYEWARHALRLMGRWLSRARDAALPRNTSGRRSNAPTVVSPRASTPCITDLDVRPTLQAEWAVPSGGRRCAWPHSPPMTPTIVSGSTRHSEPVGVAGGHAAGRHLEWPAVGSIASGPLPRFSR
jgi:uncharacterized protein (TIGR02611 family)